MAGRADQLQTSSTNVGHEHAGAFRETVGGRSIGESGFFLWTDDAEWYFEPLNSLYKLDAIRGFTDRRGSNSADVTNLEPVTSISHRREDLDRAAHCFIAQSAGGSECSPEAWLVFGFVDGGQAAVTAELSNCEEDCVGPHIDGCKPVARHFPT